MKGIRLVISAVRSALARADKELRWRLRIGWVYDGSFPWLHSFTHQFHDARTGTIRYSHDPC